MHRNRWAVTAATLVVVTAVSFGLLSLGGPGKQRLIQADLRTLQTLQSLAQSIGFAVANTHGQMPETVNGFPGTLTQNPVTGQAFVYHAKAGTAYELCAIFAAASPASLAQEAGGTWVHPKGNYCFHLDASQPIPQIPYRY